MENTVRVRSTYTQKELVAFARLLTFRLRPVLLVLYGVMIVFCLLVFGLTVWAGEPDYLLVAFPIILIAVLAFMWFMPVLTAKKSHALNMDVVFTFSDDGVSIAYDSDKLNGQETVRYATFLRVYECNGRVYLMLNKGQGFIVDVTRLEEGTVDDLHHLLNVHVDPKKYKRI